MSEIPSISSTSTTAQRRKIKKPLIEKRRRLRINQSLANLKSLVLEATQKDENCFPKMEKADILEMTVAYMTTTTKHRLPVASTGPAAPLPGCDDQLRTYLSGFQECAIQVCSFLMDESTGGVVGGGGGGGGRRGADLRGQLTQHLSGCFHRMELDFKTRKERQATTGAFCSNSTDEPAKGRKKKIQCEDRLCPLSSSSSSSSDNNDVRRATSSSSALSSLVAAAAAASLSSSSSSSNYKAEMPRIVGVCSAGNPSHFPTPLHSSSVRESPPHRNPVGAELACHSTTTRKSNSVVSQAAQRIVSSLPPNKSSSLLIQQHQYCRSPQKGDDFPLSFAASSASSASRSSPISNAVETTRYAINPPYRFHHESIHAADCNNNSSSAIWRPW